jgi:hypothetical protein
MEKIASYKLPVIVMKQGKSWVAYSPVLDLSTSATTEKKLRHNFSEAVELFFEELIAMGTLNTVLTELGWKKVRSSWTPPLIMGQSLFGVKIPTQYLSS